MKERDLLDLLEHATSVSSSQQNEALLKVLVLLQKNSPAVRPLVLPICLAIIGKEASPPAKKFAYEIFQQSFTWTVSWDEIKLGIVKDMVDDNLIVRRSATAAMLSLPEHFMQDWINADEGCFFVATIIKNDMGSSGLALAMRTFGSFCFQKKFLQRCKVSQSFFGNMKLVFGKITCDLFSQDAEIASAASTVAIQLLQCISSVHQVTCYGSCEFWSAEIAFFLGRMICVMVFALWTNRPIIFLNTKHSQVSLANSMIRLLTLALESILNGKYDRLCSVVHIDVASEYETLAEGLSIVQQTNSKLDKCEVLAFVRFFSDHLYGLLDFPSPAMVFEAASCGVSLSVLPNMPEAGSVGFVDALLLLQSQSGGKFGYSIMDVLCKKLEHFNPSLQITLIKEVLKVSLQTASSKERIRLLTVATSIAVDLALKAKLATRNKQYPLPQAEIRHFLESELVESILWNENQNPATLRFREEFLVSLLETVYSHEFSNLFILHKLYRLHRTGGKIARGAQEALFNAAEWTSVSLEVLEHCVSCLGWATSGRVAIFQSYLKMLGHVNLVLLSLRGFGGADFGERKMQTLLGKIAQVIPKLPLISAQLRALWVVSHHLRLEATSTVTEKRVKKNWKKILNSMNVFLSCSSFKAAEAGPTALLDVDNLQSDALFANEQDTSTSAGEPEIESIMRRLVAFARQSWQKEAVKGVLRKYSFEHSPDTFLSKRFEELLRQMDENAFSKGDRDQEKKRAYTYPFDLLHGLEYDPIPRGLDAALYLNYHAGVSKKVLQQIDALRESSTWTDITGPGDPIYGMAKHEICLFNGKVDFLLRMSFRNQLEMPLRGMKVEVQVEDNIEVEIENSMTVVNLAPHEEKQMTVSIKITEFCDAKVSTKLTFPADISACTATPMYCRSYCLSPAKQIIPSVWEENFYSFDLMWSSLLFGYTCECTAVLATSAKGIDPAKGHNLLPSLVYTGQRLFDNRGETLCQQYYIGRTCDAKDIAVLLELKEVDAGQVTLDFYLRSSSKSVTRVIAEGFDSFLDEVSNGILKSGTKKRASASLRREHEVKKPDELDDFILSPGPVGPSQSRKVDEIAKQLAENTDNMPELVQVQPEALPQPENDVVTKRDTGSNSEDPVSNILKMFDSPSIPTLQTLPGQLSAKFYASDSSDEDQEQQSSSFK